MRLLVTRPMPDARETARELEAAGHEAVLEPLSRIVFGVDDPPDLSTVQALIATSRNGLRAVEHIPSLGRARDKPLYAVGPATASLARKMAFVTVHQGRGRARDLPRLIARRCRPRNGSLLHLAGARVAVDLKTPLAALGFDLIQRTLYRAEDAEAFSPAVVAALEQAAIDGVILMSPASARSYVRLITSHGLMAKAGGIAHFCLSEKVARALGEIPARTIRVSPEPNSQELLALIGRGVTKSS